jgi:hypothetical protein
MCIISVVMNGRMVVSTEFGCGKKQLYCPSTCLQKLRATGNNLRQDNQVLNHDSHPGTRKYFTLMPTKDIIIFGNSCYVTLVVMLPLLW